MDLTLRRSIECIGYPERAALITNIGSFGGGERVRVLDVFQKLEVDGEALKQRVEIIVVKIE